MNTIDPSTLQPVSDWVQRRFNEHDAAWQAQAEVDALAGKVMLLPPGPRALADALARIQQLECDVTIWRSKCIVLETENTLRELRSRLYQ